MADSPPSQTPDTPTTNDVIRDMLFLLQGIEPVYLHTPCQTSELVRAITPEIDKTCAAFRALQQTHGELIPVGRTQRAVFDTYDTLLISYYEALAEIDGNLHKHKDISPIDMYRHSLVCRDQLRHLNDLFTTSLSLGPGNLLSYLDTESRSPYAERKRLAERFLADASRPLFNLLFEWLFQGIIDDSHSDFFLRPRLHHELFNYTSLQQSAVPAFLERLKDEIKLIGEGILFLRDEGQDTTAITALVDAHRAAFSYQSRDLEPLIHQLARLVHQNVLQYITTHFSPLQHTNAIRLFILLFQGDFASTLIELLDQALSSDMLNQSTIETYFLHALGAVGAEPGLLRCTLQVGDGASLEDVRISYVIPKPLQLIITKERLFSATRVSHKRNAADGLTRRLYDVQHGVPVFVGAEVHAARGGGAGPAAVPGLCLGVERAGGSGVSPPLPAALPTLRALPQIG